MKAKRGSSARRRRSAGVLILAAWALLLLSGLAVALSGRVAAHVAATQAILDRTRGWCAARAGVEFAIAEARLRTNAWTDLSQSWSDNPDALKDAAAGGGIFSVVCVRDPAGGGAVTNYGLADEERKLNVNFATNEAGRAALESLLRVAGGLDRAAAAGVAACVADWVDADDDPSADGAETAYYSGRLSPYPCHNGPMDRIEELLLVKGVEPDLFLKIEKYLTVFGPGGGVNINTAEPVVLRSLAGARKGSDQAACDALVRRIVDFRKAGNAFTSADKRAIMALLYGGPEGRDGGRDGEWAVLEWLINHRLVAVQSRFFCGISTGRSPREGAPERRISFVYDREKDEIRAWNED